MFHASGSIGLNEPRIEIERGQRVLIVAAEGSGGTCLFRAVAGLWPWGSCRIRLPAGDRVMFMPKRPFIPDGVIDRILAYPEPSEAFEEEQLVAGPDAAGPRLSRAPTSSFGALGPGADL